MQRSLSAAALGCLVLLGCGPGEEDSAPLAVQHACRARMGATASPSAVEPTVPSRSVSGDRRPNLLWIVLDACRARNLSAYGYERETSPNLRTLGERGVVFEHNFAQSNSTLHSVSSYLTGRYFPAAALSENDWRRLFRTPPPEEKLFAEVMRRNGYHTALFTAHPYFGARSRAWRSFDERTYVPAEDAEKGYARFEDLNEEVLPWVERNADVPFFLYVHSLDTHFPHDPPPPHDRWLPADAPSDEPPFSDSYREYLRGLHDGSIHDADEQVGRILDALDGAGVLDNTVVLVMSDHGDLLGEDGRTVGHPTEVATDEVLHVPWILAGAGLPEGKRVSALTQNADIVPTLIELLELETEIRPDGASALPLVRGEVASIHDWVFGVRAVPSDDDPPVLLLRTEEYRYELDPAGGGEHLWAVPDLLAVRRDRLAAAPQEAERLRTAVDELVLPRWRRYAALERTSPTEFAVPVPPEAEPREAWVTLEEQGSSSHADDRWTLREGLVRSCGFREDAPPITLRLDVPDGEFCVQLGLRVLPQPAQPGTSMAVRVAGESEFRALSASGGATAYEYVDLGVYTVDRGVFEVTLDEAGDSDWAIAREFRFLPVGQGSEDDVQEFDDRIEQLRALGYVH